LGQDRRAARENRDLPLVLATLSSSSVSLATALALALQPAPVNLPLTLTHSVSAYASFSPDGTRILHQSSGAGRFDIHEFGRDGGGVRVLVASPADEITPVDSPDGKKILFVSLRDGNREIYLRGERGRPLPRRPDESPRERHPSRLVEGRLANPLQLSSNRAATRSEGDSTQSPDFDIFEMAANGSGVRQITRGPEVDTYASWSPDGSRRIVTRRMIGEDSEVFLLDRDGSNAKNLTNAPRDYDGWPAFSPDGSRIAYAGGGPDDGNHFIFVVKPDGTGRTQVTFPLESQRSFRYDTQPTFSPDGEWIAFTRYRPTTRYESAEIRLVRVPLPPD
jgi:Tol biopolymer transport system component